MFDVITLVGIVIAISQVIKIYVNTKFIPIINIVISVMIGIVYLGGTLEENVLNGIIIGLTASGVFDLTKVAKK
jgi:hypothetical protein